jgi:hypothetical protein
MFSPMKKWRKHDDQNRPAETIKVVDFRGGMKHEISAAGSSRNLLLGTLREGHDGR